MLSIIMPTITCFVYQVEHRVCINTLQYLTREYMAKAGLPTPRNARINAPEDVMPAGEHVGFPAVIKPVSGEVLRLRV